ncbi:hypothetical protein QIT00_34265 [Streptomyces sp. B-S-A12]|uniref:Uncharacterized protein n=1 Tax=Streptomyces luteolus TaxID=3043615 RepID=A0ABT6T6N6_9ACTN|nr:hypothetical protein [Streptomyces sp. B-S-A12]MDI3423553.1 hypothetical protein [Streptomyces sp. B-S-A12]
MSQVPFPDRDHRTALRLLPWSSDDGKPCFVLGDGNGPVSRIADEIECVQLAMAQQLLGHARELLECPRVSVGELRFLGRRLSEALTDALRVAESRGLPSNAHAPQGALRQTKTMYPPQ